MFLVLLQLRHKSLLFAREIPTAMRKWNPTDYQIFNQNIPMKNMLNDDFLYDFLKY